ncbi:hypothetical protein BDY19DRAFT_169212 [Irpex rosettiformis]|uniref:Uncharacterized protein n=1 Tax=Irpex rosettiformis TaxID=378272 RepID=A0ACB8U2S3_9APHY|nr:hypothetical protein BDY19DRAFT_169212 [Irpex rosettiformis]
MILGSHVMWYMLARSILQIPSTRAFILPVHHSLHFSAIQLRTVYSQSQRGTVPESYRDFPVFCTTIPRTSRPRYTPAHRRIYPGTTPVSFFIHTWFSHASKGYMRTPLLDESLNLATYALQQTENKDYSMYLTRLLDLETSLEPTSPSETNLTCLLF